MEEANVMKRVTQLTLGCVVVLMLVSLAAAQQMPTPVVRIGDWVEVGNEAFINFIGGVDLRFRSTKNYDFEDDIRDRSASRDPFNTVPLSGEADIFWTQARLGFDFRYQKNLTARVLFQWEGVLDGNLTDNRSANDTNPGGVDAFGRPAVSEGESTNLERLWIEYNFPAPADWLRMFVGFEQWCPDQACLISDDDPRFTVFANFGALEFKAAAVLQSTSLRLGLQNDNDFVYYVFGGRYNFKPHILAVDVAYFRDRFRGAPTGSVTARPGLNGFLGQKHDSVLIMPSWTGGFGPFRGLAQFNLLLGTAEGTSQPSTAQLAAGATPSQEYDLFAWSVVAYGQANLGLVAPFLGFIYATGDDDPTDDELNGFATLPQREITILASGLLSFLDRAISFGQRDLACPARADSLNPSATLAVGGNIFGGQECGHSVGNPFNDRIGNTSHAGLETTYSNPGTLLAFGGVQVFPLKGHQLNAVYFYRAMIDTELIERALGRNIDETQYHEVMLQWQWTLNPHFDIRLTGNALFAGEGSKDIAESVLRCGSTRTAPCEGEDVALAGEARFRVQF
jgi:hypothetical protein